MPRVNNEASAVANRAIEKFLALHTSMNKYDRVKKSLAKIDPKVDAELYSDATDHLKRIEEDRNSVAGTLLGMHQKSVTSDFDTLRSFLLSFVVSLASDADEKNVKGLKEAFPELVVDDDNGGLVIIE